MPVALLPVVSMPPGGSHFKSTASILIRNKPIKNEGIDIAANMATITSVSNQEYCLYAEITPMITAITQVKKVDTAASKKEFQIYSLNS
ncbi:hypothetical protein D3C76_935420 [compost metagenome]